MRNAIVLALAVQFAAAGCNKAPAVPETPTVGDAAEIAKLKAIEAGVAGALNAEADPCVDFYEYACGGWVEKTELPADKTRISRSFTTISDANQKMLRGILEEAAKNPGEDADRQKVGRFYQTCMDEAAIEAKGIEPVQALLTRIDGAKDLAEIWLIAADMQFAGGSPFYGAGVEPDYKDPTFNRLGLAQGGLGLPDRTFYLEEDSAAIEQGYRAYLAKLMVLAGQSEADAKKNADAVVEFEEAMATLHWKREEMRDADKTYHPMALKELDALTPSLDWKAHFKTQGYGDIDAINMNTPDVFTGMDALLKKTPVGTLKAYLTAHALSGAAPYLSSAFDQANFEFYGKTLRGQQEQRPRWKRCVSRTESAMGEVLGKVYVDRAFAGDSKAVAVDMITRIEGAFEKGMDDLDWMDDATRKVAVGKSQAITNKIGYPDKWRDYGPLAIEEGNHWGNVEAAKKFTSKYWLDQVGQPVDKDIWYMSPQQVNAYYNPLANEIAFPAGILQPPFFSREFPKAMNFGGIGMVMAHEVSHGFDDSGRKFSATGELTEWWAPEVAERFEERAQCIVDQYDGYEVQPDLFVNGKLTLGENIADLGGLKQSHRAYMAWVEENGAEPEVAGLTGEQLLFVAFAQGWCSIYTPEAQKVQVRSDPHSPARFRVNGPVKNLPAFGKAFECEQGAPLYPTDEDVCIIW
ncbi:MAG: M13 family metallopeptidase [Myxococcota bacterium]